MSAWHLSLSGTSHSHLLGMQRPLVLMAVKNQGVQFWILNFSLNPNLIHKEILPAPTSKYIDIRTSVTTSAVLVRVTAVSCLSTALVSWRSLRPYPWPPWSTLKTAARAVQANVSQAVSKPVMLFHFTQGGSQGPKRSPTAHRVLASCSLLELIAVHAAPCPVTRASLLSLHAGELLPWQFPLLGTAFPYTEQAGPLTPFRSPSSALTFITRLIVTTR